MKSEWSGTHFGLFLPHPTTGRVAPAGFNYRSYLSAAAGVREVLSAGSNVRLEWWFGMGAGGGLLLVL